eukprot:15475877-Alexandrium_andersonii.AAC.1
MPKTHSSLSSATGGLARAAAARAESCPSLGPDRWRVPLQKPAGPGPPLGRARSAAAADGLGGGTMRAGGRA